MSDTIDVANRYSVLEGLEISSVEATCVKIRDSIKSSAQAKIGILETHRNKPWFNQECSELATKRKQAKLLWLQNPNDQTEEDLTNIRRDTCRIFRKMKRDYTIVKGYKLEEKIKVKIFLKCIRVLMNPKRDINLTLMF
jgi:hypothetical protein